jgi:hypothetical protein
LYLPLRIFDRNFIYISHLSHACYIPCPTYVMMLVIIILQTTKWRSTPLRCVQSKRTHSKCIYTQNFKCHNPLFSSIANGNNSCFFATFVTVRCSPPPPKKNFKLLLKR